MKSEGISMLKLVNWEYVSFHELDALLREDSASGRSLINEEINNRLTPLCLACKYNREDLVTVLLHHGARIDKCCTYCDRLPLHFACDHSNGNLGMVRKLLDARANVNALDSDGNCGLHLACTESNVPVVELLLENGANVNLTDIDGETPLVRACFARSTKLVDMLLKAGSDPNVLEGQPLEIAVRTFSIETLKLLIDAGACLHKGAYLSHASEHDHIEMMKLLHHYGADVNKVNILGMSPLQTACYTDYCSPIAVQLLLRWGADVHAFSDMRETALHYACDVQSLDKIRLLLSYGADPNAQDSHRLSPLLMALKNLQQYSSMQPGVTVTVIKLLLAAGAKLRPDGLERLKSTILLLPSTVVKQRELLDVLDFHASQPLSLQGLCRLKIRKCIPPNIDDNLDNLPLPRQVIKFLKFYEIWQGMARP